jgi:hypothetical protein
VCIFPEGVNEGIKTTVNKEFIQVFNGEPELSLNLPVNYMQITERLTIKSKPLCFR